MTKSNFRVGDRVRNTFKRYDGTIHTKIGTITKLWGRKEVYAATVDEDGEGPIRAPIHELRLIRHAK